MDTTRWIELSWLIQSSTLTWTIGWFYSLRGPPHRVRGDTCKARLFVLLVLFCAAVYYLGEFSKGGKYFSVSVWIDQDLCSEEATEDQGKGFWGPASVLREYLPFLNDTFPPYLSFLHSASPKNLRLVRTGEMETH